MYDDDVDLAGWELRKALRLFRRSNPSLLEWFNSPIVYYVNEHFAKRIHEVEEEYFNPIKTMYHYNHIYNKHNERYLQKEEYHMKRFLLDAPQWNNRKFGGIWSHTLGGLTSHFGFHTSLIIDGCKIKFSYSQKYLLDSVELELRLHPTHEKLQKIFEEIVLKNGYKKIKDLLLDYPPMKSWVLYVNKGMDDSGVEIFMESLDEFVKLD